jgi:ferredoxin, 2Fe-2S
MVQITYIEHDGTEHRVDVAPGTSVMKGAVNDGIPGIDADCGGACACATCLVYIEPAWQAVIGQKSVLEEAMLEFAENGGPTARLSCQIDVSDVLEGLVVKMPQRQM